MEGTVLQMSVEEFSRMDFPGQKAELVKGEPIMSPAGLEHERIGIRLATQLHQYVWHQKLGAVFGSSAGYVLANGDIRSPDVSFVTQDRLPGGRAPDGFGEFPPNLAVEIISPHDSIGELNLKVRDYFEYGVQLVWIIDPRLRTLSVYRSLTDVRILNADEIVDGETVIPGFSLRVSEIFD